jgi:hypothetical protein
MAVDAGHHLRTQSLKRVDNGKASTSLVVNPVVWGVCRRGLNPQRQREDSQGKAMVANRTGEIPPSGMIRGAYGNVGYGWG